MVIKIIEVNKTMENNIYEEHTEGQCRSLGSSVFKLYDLLNKREKILLRNFSIEIEEKRNVLSKCSPNSRSYEKLKMEYDHCRYEIDRKIRNIEDQLHFLNDIINGHSNSTIIERLEKDEY